MSKLTPEQSADVILYYHHGTDPLCEVDVARDRAMLARAALHAARPTDSILPGGETLLDIYELIDGIEYLLGGRA